ncbi:hypothetical protein KBD20_04520 [Candidatus Saccharibacteria bacterium]|nr:hypothetical protein [Candidatus Saccharibacteria bacterium]
MYRRRPAGVSVLKVFDIDDYVSLFATTVTMAVLGLFILHAGHTINTLIRFNTTAIDDAAHLSLTLTDYDNMGYVYGPTSSVRDKIPSQQTVSYPQGWHLSNSLWWHSVSDNLGTSSLLDIRNILILFTLSRLIWYALVVFLIARLIIYLAKLARPQLSSGILLSGAMVLSLVGFLQVTWMLELLKNGFSSFLPQLAYMLALVFFAGEFFKKNSKQDKVDRYIIATSLLTAGMSLVWLLAMPVGIGAILLGLILKYNERYLQTVRRLFSKKYVQSTILSSLIIMCGLVQVAVQILYPSGSNSLNNPGGIFPINYLLLLIFFFITVVYLIHLRRGHYLISVFTTVVITPVLLAGLVYCFQIYTTGSASYYSIKLGWLVFLIVFVFGSAALFNFIGTTAKNIKAIPATAVLVTFLVFLIYSLQLPLTGLSYLRYQWSMSSAVASGITKVLSSHLKDLPEGTSVVVASGELSEDVVSSGFLNSIHRGIDLGCYITNPDYPNTSTEASASRDSNKNIFIFDQYISCDMQRNYIVVAGSNYTNLINKFGNDKRIMIIR